MCICPTLSVEQRLEGYKIVPILRGHLHSRNCNAQTNVCIGFFFNISSSKEYIFQLRNAFIAFMPLLGSTLYLFCHIFHFLLFHFRSRRLSTNSIGRGAAVIESNIRIRFLYSPTHQNDCLFSLCLFSHCNFVEICQYI